MAWVDEKQVRADDHGMDGPLGPRRRYSRSRRDQAIARVAPEGRAIYGLCLRRCFVHLAYPKRWISIPVIAAVLAVGLEALQRMAPTRDASPVDTIVKIAGATSGVVAIHSSGGGFVGDDSRDRRRIVGDGRWALEDDPRTGVGGPLLI